MSKVNGHWINNQAGNAAKRQRLSVFNPATGAVCSEFEDNGVEELNAAVEAAKGAFDTWSSYTVKQRAAVMLKIHALINKHSKELAEIIVEENGKNMTEALADVAKGNETVEWACSLPQLIGGRILEVSRGIHCHEKKEPLGVVGCIVPFNFPVMVPLWTIPIALVTGNTVVLKPSEKVPSAMLRVAELFKEAGLPDGVFNIVNGTAPVSKALIEHPDVKAISFVGSSKIAKIVADSCHKLNKRVLALGGAKNHLIALPDCTTMMCAKDITASYAGCAGQRCMAASVLIIVDTDGGAAGDALLEAIKTTSTDLTLGQAAGQVGPLIDDAAVKRVDAYVKKTVEQGGSVLLDGRDPTVPDGCAEGNWCKPTILVHKTAVEDAMQDEIFAPVLSVLRVNTWEEAIAVENNNPHGNAASIYTESGGAAEWFTKRFRAAMLGVNIGIPVPREPFSFGGLYGTDSKFGDMDTTGDGAVEFFTNRIKITSKWAPITKEKAGLPVDQANFDGSM